MPQNRLRTLESLAVRPDFDFRDIRNDSQGLNARVIPRIMKSRREPNENDSAKVQFLGCVISPPLHPFSQK